MTGTRAWTVGAALVAVLLFVAGWFLLVSPKRSDAAALRVQAAKLDQDNATARANINRLKALAAELPAQQANLAALDPDLPQHPGLGQRSVALHEPVVEGADPLGDRAAEAADLLHHRRV